MFNVTHADNPEISSSNAQFAGIFNETKQGKSTQFAGIFNHGDTAQFQAAGIYNVAQESKCQVAGIVNVTKKGGVQIGVVNVRDTADGVPIGLINIVKRGGIMEAGIEAGELVHTALTFRSGIRRLYSVIYTGYNYNDNVWAFGYGFGTTFNLTEKLRLNLELTQTTFHSKDLKESNKEYQTTLNQFCPMLDYHFAKHFKAYAGPSLNLLYQHKDGSMKIPYSIYHNDFNFTGNNMLDMWIGVKVGIRF